jgi:capsular polysaccharide biosynthesis protein
MTIFLLGLMVGLSIGYPLGLFIDKLDKRIKNNGR